MTDDELEPALMDAVDRIDELTDKIESLERRVSALESDASAKDATPTQTPTPTAPEVLDRYDRPVVESLAEGQTIDKAALVQRYLKHSRISDRGTAKERAVRLAAGPLFEDNGGSVTYTGGR